MTLVASPRRRVLISGGGIAGLTLGILLKENGWDPTIIEREAAPRTEGYVIDFAGAGWDVAERMGLIDEIRAITYQVDAMRYVDAGGRAYVSLPIASVRQALDGKYTYLRRSDLERVLLERARVAGVAIVFGTTIQSLDDTGHQVTATFDDGSRDSFSLVFGADGVHSRVRELVFGPEAQFSRFLGYYVAAFDLDGHDYDIGTALSIFEEPDRTLWVYSLHDGVSSAMYVFRHENIGYVPRHERLPLVRGAYRGAGWIAERMLADHPGTEPSFFDSTLQIVMPTWSKGRVALLGDAAACLTLLAGQGSHLAMADAYVLATELGRHEDHAIAFAAYERALRGAAAKKQREAVRFSKWFVPSKRSFLPLRHLIERLVFNRLMFRYVFRFLGKSVVVNYR